MGTISTLGKTLAGLAAGGLGILGAIKLRDDRYVDGLWRSLEQCPCGEGRFSEEMVSGLPDPARRYFLHAIRQGTPLASKVRFSYAGGIKPAKQLPWMSMAVRQIVVKERGFVWKARVQKGPLLLTGADHYLDGDSRMRIALFGLVPVVNATGPDLTRSALGRLVVEDILLPTALLPGPHVQIEGIDESRFRAVVSVQGESTPITLTVDQEGRLLEVMLQRWGNLTEDGSYRFIPYGGTVEEERTFDGYTVPGRMKIGWWYGTEDYLEVIWLEMQRAEYQ